MTPKSEDIVWQPVVLSFFQYKTTAQLLIEVFVRKDTKYGGYAV